MGDFFNIRSENIEWGLELHQPSLEILLEHGANVDLPVPGLLFLDPAMEHFFEDNTLPYTRPSFLEQCFYYSKEMYYQLVPFSSRPARDIYGDQLCLATTMGLPSFRDYIASKPSADSTILGSILAEQFFLGDKYFDSAVVRALLELGVTINTSTPGNCFTTLLCRIIRKARNLGFNENDLFIMKTLQHSRALLNSEVVALAVTDEAARTLELISSLGANFRQQGARALCRAARLNNFVATSWLLHREVDINAGIENVHHPLSVSSSVISIAIAAVIPAFHQAGLFLYEDEWWKWCGSAGCNMLEYLLDHGAKLWVGSLDSSPFAALRVILQESLRDSHLFEKIRLILNSKMQLKELPRLGFHLLEASLTEYGRWSETSPRPKIFKLLWEHGAPAHPGGVLARLIRYRAPRQLILDVINSGADINAYTTFDNYDYCNPIQAASQLWDKRLVSALLEHGANINSPALGYTGKTSLQRACSIIHDAEDTKDSTEQMNFVQFLLHNNADVNAPAAAKMGYTALQLAAYAGNIELLSLLLSHGGLVNTPNYHFGQCALDFAVMKGRLDAVHFLLKEGALSFCHGQSGYEGAIRLARKAR
ncbi:ankyrin repeat-containing domain protein [Xylaria longipes]|nr:ankyrin repeat-containing domain protein [Xylaria longipes]